MNRITFIISLLRNLDSIPHINFHLLWIMVGLLSVVSFIILFIKRKGKRDETAEPENKSRKPEAEQPILRNAAYVYGDFMVYDKQGKEIGHRFSNKLRTLFAILLLSSTVNTEGITTTKLTSLLWPDRNPAEAKNIRGVTINHLRSVLADIDGIELVHRNQRWCFVFSEAFYCNYIEISNIIYGSISRNKDLCDKEINTIRSIVRKGSLFPDLRLDWIDRFKNEYENLLEEQVIKMIRKHYRKEDHASVINLTDIYFAIDPINEEVLDICIKSLRKTGKIKQAQFLYNKFCEHYAYSMGEPYSRALLTEK